MGIVGTEVRMPLGKPWRVGKQPYGATTLGTAASVLKGFYLGLEEHRNVELQRDLAQVRLPSKADRNRSLLGHVTSTMAANPHQAWRNFATAVLDASGGNLTIARDAGGWASSATVDQIYGHTDIHDPQFDAALRKVWSRT
jgi:hypothetical protein